MIARTKLLADCSNGVTVTSNGLLDVPPTRSNVTSTNPVSSEPVYCACVNLTVISNDYSIVSNVS